MKAFWCISYILFYPFSVYSICKNGKIETIGYGFIGETLDMMCNITNPSIQKNASDIKFSLDNTELNNTFILDKKSKKLVLQLHGPEMNQAHIFCRVHNPNFTCINSRIIHVEYAPQNITNISCVNHEWDRFLSCSWSHPVEYLNQSNIQVKSRWKSNYIQDYVHCSESNYNYCNLNQGSYFSGRLMTISVEVKNTKFNVSTTRTFEFDANKIVKPPPLETVRYEILNSTCILLNWTNVRPYRNKTVNVAYKSEWQDPQEIVRYVVVKNDNYVNRTVCGLFPYTNYTFNFTVYPEYDGYASETISIITEKTRSSVPLNSPHTTGGALYYKALECQQGKLRNVTIYWQAFQEKNWFGVPRGVSIQYSKIGGLETTNTNVSWKTVSYAMQLDCNFAYDINITAENDAGPSFPPSFLHVPKYEPDFQPPRAKVEVRKDDNTNLVYVSWNEASKLHQSKVEATVFWCKKSMGSICEGQVYWEKYNNVTSTHLNTNDSPGRYTFAVSLETYSENTDRRNTGIQWEECIYIKDETPMISPKLSLISTSEDNTLSVLLEKLDCQSGSPIIIKYTVYYCMTQEKKKCKGTINQKDMQPEEGFVKLNNLEAKQEYGFWVTASSDMGEGPKSDWIYGTPVDNNLTGGEIVSIVIGGLFVLVLAVAGAVFTLRYVKTRTFSIPPIEVPDTPPVCINIPMRQHSKDSGYAEEHRNKNSEEEVGKEKEKEQNTKSTTLPQSYMTVEDFDLSNGSSPIPVPETTVGFATQNPQISRIPESIKEDADTSGDSEHCLQGHTGTEPDVKLAINTVVKCNSEPSLPDCQHPVIKVITNIQGVINHKLSAVPTISDYVQSIGNVKSSPEKSKPNGHGQLEAIDCIPDVSQHQSMLVDWIAQSQADVNNYVSNVTSKEPVQVASNSTGHSSVSNYITGIKTPPTVSEDESVVINYVTSVSQCQQILADKSTKGQPAVSGYVSIVMNSFPLSGNCNSENELSVHASLPSGISPQPVTTSMNTQCQPSVSSYVTSVINPHLPPPSNKPLLQSAVNDHVYSTQSMSAHSNNHNQPALSNYVDDDVNAEPAELNEEYQATQDNNICDTIFMQQVSMDVNPHDQTPVSNYVTSVTNPEAGSK